MEEQRPDFLQALVDVIKEARAASETHNEDTPGDPYYEERCHDCGYVTCICDQLENDSEPDASATVGATPLEAFDIYIHNFMHGVLAGSIQLETCGEQAQLFQLLKDVEALKGN